MYQPPSTMFNDSPVYGANSPEYVPGQDSPEYVPEDDDSPEFKVRTPDKQGEGIKLNIQENITNITDNISDRILGIIDAGKRSILDIDKEEDKSGDDGKDKKDDSNQSIGEKKIISTELS